MKLFICQTTISIIIFVLLFVSTNSNAAKSKAKDKSCNVFGDEINFRKLIEEQKYEDIFFKIVYFYSQIAKSDVTNCDKTVGLYLSKVFNSLDNQ